MKSLDTRQYQHWRRHARVLEADGHGEKVLLLQDGSMLKLFRKRRWLSRATFHPPAMRFVRNARTLASLGIPCPRVLALYWLGEPPRHLVHYLPVPGQSLRELVPMIDRNRQLELFARLSDFIAWLHDNGVYFRSLHMGNIILTPDSRFGLIDIADLRYLARPLSRWLRARNYHHLLRYPDDWAHVDPDIRARFGFGGG